MIKSKITNFRTYKAYEFFNLTENSVDLKTRICAFLSSDAYKEHRLGDVVFYNDENENITKWVIVETIHDTLNTGFDAYIYFNSIFNQFVIAFRGTEPKLNRQGYLDFKADFEMLREKTMKQYISAYNFVIKFLNKKLNSGIILNFKFNPIAARKNLLITGHSLGGSIAQLLGAQEEFFNIRVEAFNPLGMAEYLYRYSIKLKKYLKASNKNISEFRKIYSSDSKHPYKFVYSDKKDYKNITNYITTRDPVGAVYDHIGIVRIVKVAELNRINPKDILFVAPAISKMLKGHDQENFTCKGSLELVKNPFNYQNLLAPLRFFQGDKITKNVIAPAINLVFRR